HLLAEIGGQPLGGQAGHHVGDATRRERHDHADRPLRIFCPRRVREERQREQECEDEPYCAGASRGFLSSAVAGSGMSRNSQHTRAETKLSNASPYRPPEKVPVASFMSPIHHGPKNPPRLPIELIQAKPAASAVPLRNIGGMAKNGPFEP